jgi:lipid II:glycine glycyltransferase (peptidoglycan interpeptide bridge formation enzyme)
MALKDYLLSNNIKLLLYKAIPYIYHHYPCQEDLYTLWCNGAQLIRRDVSTTIDLEVPLKLPKGRKAQIARAKREGIRVETSNDFETFIALENSVLTQYHQTQAVHTGAELTLLHSRFPDNIRLLTAIHDNEMIAGVLLFVYDNIVHTQYMASSDYGRANGGLDLIISTIIEEYKSNKKYLDFGISTEDAGRFLNNGLISQKESFGGRSIVYDFYELTI